MRGNSHGVFKTLSDMAVDKRRVCCPLFPTAAAASSEYCGGERVQLIPGAVIGLFGINSRGTPVTMYGRSC